MGTRLVTTMFDACRLFEIKITFAKPNKNLANNCLCTDESVSRGLRGGAI